MLPDAQGMLLSSLSEGEEVITPETSYGALKVSKPLRPQKVEIPSVANVLVKESVGRGRDSGVSLTVLELE